LHVDLEQRRSVAKAEGVEAGSVVDDCATSHRFAQGSEVEKVSTHRLGPELAQAALTLVEASESSYWTTELDELSNKRTAEEPGATGDEGSFRHVG
jgi:hypothetical protein